MAAVNTFIGHLARKLEANGSETTIYLDRITTRTGETITTSQFATFGRGILTINPDGDGETTYPEWASFTAVDSSAVAVTGASRGLSALGNSAVTANKRFHPVGTPVVISFGIHNLQDILDKIDDDIAAATFGTASNVTGIAGETIATAPALVYLKNDGKWWLTDADTSATINEVQLGLALSAVAADATITNGIVRKGLVSGFTGLVAGTTYYASNTAGEISSSAGTNAKRIGIAKSTTELYFDSEYYELPTIDEKAALAGSGTPSASNPFITRNRTMTAGSTISGATTPVPVYQNKTDNEFYACDANDTAALKFIGFGISDGTDGNDIDVQFNGVVSGFTGLSEGEKYYVQDAVGTIGTSIGTYEVLVGIAISETELLIMKGSRRDSGTGSLSDASGSEVVSCGFRPSRIRVKAYTSINAGGENARMELVWVNGTVTAVSIFDESTTGLANSEARLYYNTISDYQTFSITSVTDTGFTISWTKTGSFSPTDNIYLWEVEGEL